MVYRFTLLCRCSGPAALTDYAEWWDWTDEAGYTRCPGSRGNMECDDCGEFDCDSDAGAAEGIIDDTPRIPLNGSPEGTQMGARNTSGSRAKSIGRCMALTLLALCAAQGVASAQAPPQAPMVPMAPTAPSRTINAVAIQPDGSSSEITLASCTGCSTPGGAGYYPGPGVYGYGHKYGPPPCDVGGCGDEGCGEAGCHAGYFGCDPCAGQHRLTRMFCRIPQCHLLSRSVLRTALGVYGHCRALHSCRAARDLHPPALGCRPQSDPARPGRVLLGRDRRLGAGQSREPRQLQRTLPLRRNGRRPILVLHQHALPQPGG